MQHVPEGLYTCAGTRSNHTYFTKLMKKKREQVEKLMPTYSETKRRFMSLGI
jgi:hypothetical protein